MNKFKTFLVENSYATTMSWDGVAKFALEHCKVALELQHPIWRGETFTQDLMMVNPTASPRISKGGIKNHYNILLSGVSEGWKQFPPRNRSLICANDGRVADLFNDEIYRIFPLGNPKVGLFRSSDMWSSMDYAREQFEQNNFSTVANELSYVIELLSDPPNGYEHDVDQFKAALEEADERLMRSEYEELRTMSLAKIDDLLRGMFADNPSMTDDALKIAHKAQKFGGLIKFIEDAFDPKKNEVELISLSEYDSFQSRVREIWFSGKALCVRQDQISNFFEEIKEEESK